MATYPDSVRFLYALGNEIRTAKLGLDRIGALLAALGHPERSGRFIHVAGTNGKGSVCAMAESALRAAGWRTGLYISPHLVEPTERIQIGGRPVSEAEFTRAFDEVHRAAEAMLRRDELELHPTYFETVTAMAFLLFREHGAGVTVLETGLGGRLDATNVVSPSLTAITPIDFDHERFLGSSLEAIAGEKAGILKPGVPSIVSHQRPEALAVLERRAAEVGAPLIRTADWQIEELELSPRGHRALLTGPRGPLRIECPLAGEHQVENARTAVAILETFGVPADAIEEGIRRTRWPGRLEVVCERPEIILDGAHNPAGIRALAAYIRRFYAGRRIWIVYGTMRDKSLDEIAGVLTPLAERLILTHTNSHRALRPELLRAFFDHPGVELAHSVEAALARAHEAPEGTAVFVTGSLLLVGEAKKALAQPATA
jgi:dihydrofolate synthase/folylpolyglutamate synthase